MICPVPDIYNPVLTRNKQKGEKEREKQVDLGCIESMRNKEHPTNLFLSW